MKTTALRLRPVPFALTARITSSHGARAIAAANGRPLRPLSGSYGSGYAGLGDSPVLPGFTGKIQQIRQVRILSKITFQFLRYNIAFIDASTIQRDRY
jgi:hypothetical protein